MRRLTITALLVILLAMLGGCNLPVAQPAAETPAPTTAQATPFQEPTGEPSLTPTPPKATDIPPVNPPPAIFDLGQLKNFTYTIADFQTQAALVNGAFQNSQIQVTFVEPAATGDLDGDSQPDAAVVLAVKSGGTGTFYSLYALLNQNGTLAQSASTYIGDRQGIQNLSIDDGRIILDYYTQGRKDPLCCASEHRLRSYILEDSALRLTGEQVLDGPGAQATPLPVAILIDQPGESQPLASPLQVRGRVNPVPPEGKLAYAVTDMNANLLAQGAFPVTGAPGGPGTFDFDIPLQTLSPGLVQVEIIDAADGILRGRSVVTLVAQ